MIPEPDDRNADERTGPLVRRFGMVYHRSLKGFVENRMNRRQPYCPGRLTGPFLGYTPSMDPDYHSADIPFAFKEVCSIAEGFRKMGVNALMVTGSISPAMLSELMRKFQVIHLATHAHVNPASSDPALAGLRLSAGRASSCGETDAGPLLRLIDFPRMELHCDLLVLSCCCMGRSGSRSDDRTGCIPDKILLSGARNVIYSLWNVTDRYTSRLMTGFYHYYLSGYEYPEALRRAKLDLMKDPRTSAPWIWGGFILCSA